MTLTPTTDHLTRVLKNLRADETRLTTELNQTQAAIASHLKTIELIAAHEKITNDVKPDKSKDN